MIRQQKKHRCDEEEFRTVTDKKVQDLKQSLDTNFAGDEYQPLKASSENTFNLGNMIDTGGKFSKVCPVVPDVEVPWMGSSFKIQFSVWVDLVCPYLAWMGYFVVAFAMRRGAEIIAGGMN